MNIKLYDLLGHEIKDLVKLAKEQTIRTTTAESFKMNEFNIINNGERINIYTLIPGIEDSIIIEISFNGVEKRVLLIKERIFSEITEETLDEIIARNNELQKYEMDENKLLEYLSFIPTEIAAIEKTLSKLNLPVENTILNNLYQSYCNNVKGMRNSQVEFIKAYNKNTGIKRSI